MTVALNYQKIPLEEKFIMLEKLWENMSQEASNNGFTPDWHLKILTDRERNICELKSDFSNLEDAKIRLQKFI